MAIETLSTKYSEKLKKEEEKKEREVSGCDINTAGDKVIISIPEYKNVPQMELVFAKDAFKRLIQDIYMS